MATSSEEADLALLQPLDEQELDHKTRDTFNLKQLKSIEIMQSALKIVRSNTKYMLLTVLSSLPFFVFMVFFEIKLQKAVNLASEFLTQPSHFNYFDFDLETYVYDNNSNQRKEILRLLLELCLFYLVVYPLHELFSSSIIISIAAKTYTGDKESTLNKIIDEALSQMKGSLSISLWVHFLSSSSLIGLFWIVANYCLIYEWIYGQGYYHLFYVKEIDVLLISLAAGFHALIFVAFLYKYLDWTALWNMGIVISVLEEETGIDAIEMSGYYGKRCRRTGCELMLGFFTYGVFLRLPNMMLIFGKCTTNFGVLLTAFFVGLFCLGNLVKWVVFVVYFYDCKTQTLQKKVDEEVPNASKGHEAC